MTGILERIESKLDALLAANVTPVTPAVPAAPAAPAAPSAAAPSAAAPSAAAPSAAVTPAVPAAPAVPVAPSAAAADVELDTDGVPWDERIHSSNKKRAKGGKGAWMRRKNVSDLVYSQITAELRETYSGITGATRPHTVDGEPQDVESQKAAPPPPAGVDLRTVNTNNVAPPPPANNITPERAEAVSLVNELTKKTGIKYDAMIQYFIDNYNVGTFDEVPPIKFKFVVEDLKEWQVLANDIGKKVADIKQVYINDITVIEPYIEACFNSVKCGEAVCQSLADVPFDKLAVVQEAVTKLHQSVQGL